MRFIRFMTLVFAALFISLSPLKAQDHSHHMMNHDQPEAVATAHVDHAPAAEKKGGCKDGQCPLKKAENCPCCKNGQCPMMKHGMSGMSMPAAKAPWERESAAVMGVMHENMAQPYTGDADADFIRGMIPHHQGAVEMARIVLQYGDDEQAKDLARRIVVAQKGEIAWMQKWLRQRQIPETGAYSFNR